MSSSLTAPTSTTGSSISFPSPTIEIVACGALAGHVREIVARRGWPAAVSRLPGLHCYDVFGGADRIAAMFDAEPGTYVLTDFLLRSFDRSVLAELGLDRYPELWDDYFGHYTRLVWLAQEPSPALEAEADRVAGMFGLPLTRVDVGVSRLEQALACLRELLSAPRYEVIPAKGIEQAVAEWVPAGMTVAVTASPVKGLEPTVELAEKLAARGYRMVPHLAARSVTSDAHLAEIVTRLKAAGCDDVFVPGGDATHPAGPFDGALPLLERLDEMGRPFGRIGITGYPESHPKIGDDITIQAMWDKRRYASYIVSNVTFDAAGLGRWIGRIRARGVTLPLQLGLAGPAERTRLLRMAAVAGASESARFITRHPGWILG